MSPTSRHLISAAAIIACIGAIALGNHLRGVVEHGQIESDSRFGIDISTVTASKEGLDISGPGLFYRLMELLENRYVEGVDDERALAIGAVEGMIAGLTDPDSYFMDPEQYETFLAAQRGEFEGIGVEIDYRFDEELLEKYQDASYGIDAMLLAPDVMISAVLPGGAAAEAGLRTGDRIVRINDKWVISVSDISELADLGELVAENPDRLQEYRDAAGEMSEKIESSVTAPKAKELLTSGDEGEILLTYERDGEIQKSRLNRSEIDVPAVRREDDIYHLRLFENLGDALAKSSIPSRARIDLRNSTQGDPEALSVALDGLAPAGDYGRVVTDNGRVDLRFTSSGDPIAGQYTLLVDSSTRGAAKMLALALKQAGLAQLEGSLSATQPVWTEVFELPDGSAYTLATGVFTTEVAK